LHYKLQPAISVYLDCNISKQSLG